MTSRRTLLVVAATMVLSVGGTFLAKEVFGDEPPIAGAIPGQMRSMTLDQDREYFVHLPEGYQTDTAARYPVVYVLDGPSQSGHTADAAAVLARVGMIPSVIVVGVPAVNAETRNLDYTPPNMRLDNDAATSPMGEADRFLTYLRSELIPRIAQDYRTARPHMLAGWSRGGLFVVYSMLAEPRLFDGRFAHSPALWRENDLIVTQLKQALATDSAASGFLYLSLGTNENEKMTGAFEHAVRVLGEVAPPGLRWREYRSGGGTHESNPRLSTPVGLCLMLADTSRYMCEPLGSQPASR
jgi:predicted alpha/beta superfamily hydrolase